LPKEVREFCISLVKKTIEYREQNNESRKDFMQLLMQLRNTGEVGQDGEWAVKSTDESKKTMTIEQCAAQVFVMYIAGFETSSATTSFCMYELCKNPALMKTVQDEIKVTLAKHGGAITYESIQDMTFLELCFAGL
jgi:cytochrome P450 family 6